MSLFVLLMICGVFSSTISQKQDVNCFFKDIGKCSVTNLNSTDGQLNFLTKTKSYRDRVAQITFEESILKIVPSGIFTAYKNIVYFNLYASQVEDIETNALEGAFKLKEINLSGNKISHLDSAVFNGAENLEELYLGDNNIEELPNGIFTKLTKLKLITLYYNRIKNLDDSTFSSLRNLNDLSLKGNKLSVISPNLFAQNTELKYLDLRENEITDELEYAIKNLSKLENLDLTGNKLTKLNNYPESVKVIRIEGNQLTKLFIKKNIVSLYASSNKITEISAERDNKLKDLRIYGNNIWTYESIQNLKRIQDFDIQADPRKQITDLFMAKNSVFMYLCLLSKQLMPACRDLNFPRHSNFAGQDIKTVYSNCVNDFFKIIA